MAECWLRHVQQKQQCTAISDWLSRVLHRKMDEQTNAMRGVLTLNTRESFREGACVLLRSTLCNLHTCYSMAVLVQATVKVTTLLLAHGAFFSSLKEIAGGPAGAMQAVVPALVSMLGEEHRCAAG
jgi:hypothetical protein